MDRLVDAFFAGFSALMVLAAVGAAVFFVGALLIVLWPWSLLLPLVLVLMTGLGYLVLKWEDDEYYDRQRKETITH